MKIGSLNRLVTIQRPGPAVDEWNQPIPGGANWIDVCRPWASIKHLSGTQAIKGDAVTSAVRTSIRIRYRLGLDAGMRVVHGAAIYNVLAVAPDEGRRDFTDLVCELKT